MSPPPVTIFGLGGTIAMAAAPGGGAVPALDADALVSAVPGIAEVADITVVNFRELPGAHLALADIVELAVAIGRAQDAGAAGAVVTQGTDTLEETAYVLDILLDPTFPVAVTGAMRHPGLPGADGAANLLAAVAVAASPEAPGIGTVVVLGDEIHAASLVAKTHATKPGAFASPAGGPIGFLAEGRPRFTARPLVRTSLPLEDIVAGNGADGSGVALITLGLGDDAALTHAALESRFRGLVIEALGAGHASSEAAEALGEAAARMPVVLASRTGAGTVLAHTYGFAGSESDLIARGLIRAGWLSGPKARLLLALALAAGFDEDQIRTAFAPYGGG